MSSKNKNYTMFVTQEVVFNEKYSEDYKGGRVELYKEGTPYAISEHRFFVPNDIYDEIIERFDGKSIDSPFQLQLDILLEE